MVYTKNGPNHQPWRTTKVPLTLRTHPSSQHPPNHICKLPRILIALYIASQHKHLPESEQRIGPTHHYRKVISAFHSLHSHPPLRHQPLPPSRPQSTFRSIKNLNPSVSPFSATISSTSLFSRAASTAHIILTSTPHPIGSGSAR